MTTRSFFRLRVGDVIEHNGQQCPVVRVTECAAVLAFQPPRRTFTTLFGKQVTIQPKPALVRISANAEVPILNRPQA